MTRSSRALSRTLVLATCAAALTSVAFADSPGPAAVVKSLADAGNRGDWDTVKAMVADDVVIVDDLPPYEWHGPETPQTFLDAVGAFNKARGRTDGKGAGLTITRTEIDGDGAYVVLRYTYTFREHGRRFAEEGSQAYTLHNGSNGWKVTGIAWVSGHPHIVAAKLKSAAPTTAPAKKPS